MLLTLIAITALSTVLFTTVSSAQLGWSAGTNIFDLRVFNGESVFGQAQSLNSVGRCSSGQLANNNAFRLDTDSPFFAETYSILLTAQTTGRRVQLYRTGECQGTSSFPIVNGARLLN